MKPKIDRIEKNQTEEQPVTFNESDFQHEFLEKSRFEMMFSQQVSDLIKNNEKELKRVLKERKVKLQVDYDSRNIFLRTTSKTRDPFTIIECRDFISLVLRGISIKEALKIFKNENTHLIFNLKNVVKDKKVLINRRNRLIGPNESILNGLRMLTNCFIQVEKKSVCVIGEYQQVLVVEEFIRQSMNNYHPVHLLKQLIAKNECKNDKNKKNMDWKNFIPEVTKKVPRRQ